MRRTIGEMIRILRKEKMITQEKLAEALNVSFQSVSRWENGLANPDISLIPVIARYFEVSTDYLFDVKNEELEKIHLNYKNKYKQMRSEGDISGCIALMEEARKIFPKDYEFMMNLAEVMECCACGNTFQKQCYIDFQYAEQIYALCRQVLNGCAEDVQRLRAVQLLCNYYVTTGNMCKAVELLESVADIRHCREIMMGEILHGEDRLKLLQENILFCVEYAAETMSRLAFRREYGLSDKLSADEKIAYIRAALTLYETVFSDGNYQYYHRPVCWNYRRLAELYLLKNDVENAYQALLCAKMHAEAFDLRKIGNYTSMFVNKVTDMPQMHEKEWIGTERKMLLYRIQELEIYFQGHEGMQKLKEYLEIQTQGEPEIEIE